MKYTVIHSFRDTQDNNYTYSFGDAYPRKGKRVKAERIQELLSKDNKREKPLIEVVNEN